MNKPILWKPWEKPGVEEPAVTIHAWRLSTRSRSEGQCILGHVFPIHEFGATGEPIPWYESVLCSDTDTFVHFYNVGTLLVKVRSKRNDEIEFPLADPAMLEQLVNALESISSNGVHYRLYRQGDRAMVFKKVEAHKPKRAHPVQPAGKCPCSPDKKHELTGHPVIIPAGGRSPWHLDHCVHCGQVFRVENAILRGILES